MNTTLAWLCAGILVGAFITGIWVGLNDQPNCDDLLTKMRGHESCLVNSNCRSTQQDFINYYRWEQEYRAFCTP